MEQTLCSAGWPCEILCYGLCGFTAERLLNQARSPHISSTPPGKGLACILHQDGPFDLVIMMVGTNDLGARKNPTATLANIARLHLLCHELGIPTISIAPPAAKPFQQARQCLADQLGAWASNTPGVALSLDSEVLLPRSMVQLWDPDGIHLSPQGSNWLGKKLASHVRLVIEQSKHSTTKELVQPSNAPGEKEDVDRTLLRDSMGTSLEQSEGNLIAAALVLQSLHQMTVDIQTKPVIRRVQATM
jgi:isochorismate hydrolase